MNRRNRGSPMSDDTLRAMLRRHSFVPLEIHLSSQETSQIRHLELAMVLPSRLIQGLPKTDRTMTCSLIHIARVRELEPAA